jgi:hypothetical protein
MLSKRHRDIPRLNFTPGTCFPHLRADTSLIDGTKTFCRKVAQITHLSTHNIIMEYTINKIPKTGETNVSPRQRSQSHASNPHNGNQKCTFF